MLQIYNSLTRRKERFTPIDAGKVRMYVCGMTVYDYCHVGHARVMVVFDVVLRYLRFRGYEVTYVRNITDIDDKIIRRAHESGEDFRALTERFIEAMHEDMAPLGILAPSFEPRATETMDDIVNMVRRLIERGFAYVAANGDVYYDVSRFEDYGKLANKKLEDLRAGARVEVEEAKHDPLDFVLWKAAKPDEPAWPSPWGPGRPGWHIECSAMSQACLGSHFDIHGGGMDLKFPHHENEIAQSEAASGQKFVNYWMHNGFVQINEEKMSKSLGNFFTVRDVLRHLQPAVAENAPRDAAGEIIRLFILSSHYLSPLNYSDENLAHARASLDRLYIALRGLAAPDTPLEASYRTRFEAAMDDDFNTPEALAVLFDLAHEINRARQREEASAADRLGATLRALGGVLGLLQADPEHYLKSKLKENTKTIGLDAYLVSEAEIVQRIAKRDTARKERNWAEADRLRAELEAQGIVLEDGPDGTTWRWG